MKPKYFAAVKKSKAVGEITIYGYISDQKWRDTDITPTEVKNELDKIKGVTQINLFINSGGGNVFAGTAIYNQLKRNKANVTAYIDGIAASIASVVAMAADEIRIPKNGMIMIHNPWAIAAGDSNEFRKLADNLDKIGEIMLATYMGRVNVDVVDEDEVKNMMDESTWITGEEAVKMGFADVLEEEVEASLNGSTLSINGQDIDVSEFKNFPADKINNKKPVKKKEKKKVQAKSPEPVEPNYDQYETQLAENQVKINQHNLQEV